MFAHMSMNRRSTTTTTTTTTTATTTTTTTTTATTSTTTAAAEPTARTGTTAPTTPVGDVPTPSPEPPTPFECPNANEEACATGRECFRSKLKCDGSMPDCADGSDESTLACSSLLAQVDTGEDDNKKDAEGKDNDSDTATMMWGLIGAVVGVGACGILTYLYVNGCSSKADGGTGAGKDEAVKEFSQKLSNAVYTRGSTDGELYGTAGPNSAGAGQGDGGQNYAEIGLIEGGAYANVVDGDDGGYMLTSATGTPSGKGVYDLDFAAPTSTVGLALLGVFLSCVVSCGGASLSGNGGPAVNAPCYRGTHLPLVPTT